MTIKNTSILLTLGASAVMAISGCSNLGAQSPSLDIAVEPLGPSTKKEIGNKFLHMHSLQQQLMFLGSKKYQKIIFSNGSDDIFVSDEIPNTFALASSKVLGEHSHLTMHIDNEGKYVKKIRIKNAESSIYFRLLRKHITTRTILENDNLSSSFLVSSDADTRALTESLGVNKYGFFPVNFIFNRIYTQGKRVGTNVYFSYSEKSKVLSYTTTPKYFYLTPYKRQLFVNYLDSAGITYLTSRDNGIAISDNFENWAKSMEKLGNINKYQYSVYGVFDGKNFYEISDSNYRDSALVVEMIEWIPGGKRAYNIYFKGHHRKVLTDQRFIHFYSSDGKTKFLIRFY